MIITDLKKKKKSNTKTLQSPLMVQAVILSAEGQDTGQTPTVVREAATRPARGANGKGKAPEAGTCRRVPGGHRG